jgi:hypothetical protein
MSEQEMADAFAGAYQMLNDLERRLAAKKETPEAVRATLVKVIGALASHGRPGRTSDKPFRGVGYGQMGRDGYTTPDEAMIVASLPWFKGNMSAAIRAHYPFANADDVRVHARRIRDRQTEIAEFEGNDRPWETSSNWLGDLPTK